MNRIESNRNENEMNPTPALFRPSVSRVASRTTAHHRTATRETFRRAVASRFAAPSRARVCRRAGNTAASGGETVPQTPACGTAAPDASVYTVCIDTFIIQYVSKIHIILSIPLVHTRARTPRRANARATATRVRGHAVAVVDGASDSSAEESGASVSAARLAAAHDAATRRSARG